MVRKPDSPKDRSGHMTPELGIKYEEEIFLILTH